MSGPPVRIVEKGGLPVRAVETGAPVLVASESRGYPITITDRGVPFVVRGLDSRTPAGLFASGEQGVWYDPSDLSTLYQDHLGTTPAAYGQPVGLMLDKSKGRALGPERVTNGAFDNGISGWEASGTAAVSPENGAMKVSVTGASGGFRSAAPLTAKAGALYEVSLFVRNVDYTGVFNLSFSATSVPITPTEQGQVHRFIAPAASTNPGLLAARSGTPTGSYIIDNISVRELPGNHASQPTVTARPTLMQDAGGRAYLQFDGVDDLLKLSQPLAAGDWDFCLGYLRPLPRTMLLIYDTTSYSQRWIGAADKDSANHAMISGGAGTSRHLRFNNASASPATRGERWALMDAANVVHQGVNGMMSFAEPVFGKYPVGPSSIPPITSYVIRQGRMTEDQLTQLAKWQASKAGVTL